MSKLKGRSQKIFRALKVYLVVGGIGLHVFVLWMVAGWPIFFDRWLNVAEKPIKAHAIVCLGKGLSGNDLPLERGWSVIQRAIALYSDGWADKVVFSGGAGKRIPEGEAYAEAAAWLGLPETVIFIDPLAESTAEHAQNILKIKNLGINKHSPLIIVTSPLHARRSCLCFKKAGYTNFRMVTDYEAGSRDARTPPNMKKSRFKDFRPSQKKYNDVLLRLRIRSSRFIDATREIVAIAWYRIKGFV